MPKYVITYFVGSPTGASQEIEADTYKIFDKWIDFKDQHGTVLATIAASQVARIQQKEN